jgi:hypothetical protein
MKEHNPMDTVLFYQTRDREMGDESFPMQPSDVSNMLGSVYQVRLCGFGSKQT